MFSADWKPPVSARGLLMTMAGGIGHTLPYLIPHFRTATAVAVVAVAIEVLLISWIRHRYMNTPFFAPLFK